MDPVHKKLAANQFKQHTPSKAALIWTQLRPKQWSKNLLVFAALLFSIDRIEISKLALSTIGFVLFSLVSSTIYIINDFMDREADRVHPTKCHRPMASGLLSPALALTVGAVLLLFALPVSWLLNPLFTLLLALYILLNISYSLYLKHVVIVDLMIIASGFVLRAIAGGVVINVPLTPWFLLCTLLLSLFLAIGKRRHELILLHEGKSTQRKVLESYSVPLLDQLNTIVTTATIISYSLFTFTSGRTVQLMWTIPFVIYGIFRYLYLIHVCNKGGSPDRVLFEDKPILVTVVLYAISVVVILVTFET
ncbi:decaprenyl-phosphate phosphoribosyltransferase [Paenibacillus donghaensis]|uniref:Decaprenyl-phosphate phosphoribosyltransferase n=1 Tax=Paenibacillus donghaensis TaxID=414771 RepID=A0A2Z2KBJ6_9BACL|nr:decaprenyl-phosphate phosphoribosyltransferase [Paenibacillus donghaensis]ASA24086.1 decaprenyl-phosphate phosphoribosyltransferase [Paenibacillus donghaensis]